MDLAWQGLGERLVSAGSQCKSRAVLVAPFVKAETLKRIVDVLAPSVSLVCLTRWRLEELAAGVSDLECWDLISARDGGHLLLLANLHAKYFRFDDVAYLGSANLTMTALGWSPRSNAEALIEFHVSELDLTGAFEQALFQGAVEVTLELAEEFRAMLTTYSMLSQNAQSTPLQDHAVRGDSSLPATPSWFPRSRSPEYLYEAYVGVNDAMSESGLAAARADLLDLDLPIGLGRPAFVSLVRSRLAVTPIVLRLDQFLTVRRRFGEIRFLLAEQLGVRDATDHWQRLMRWLLMFMPERYEAVSPNYSEMFSKRCDHGVPT